MDGSDNLNPFSPAWSEDQEWDHEVCSRTGRIYDMCGLLLSVVEGSGLSRDKGIAFLVNRIMEDNSCLYDQATRRKMEWER